MIIADVKKNCNRAALPVAAVALFALVNLPLAAQSAAEIDAILEVKAVSWAQACKWVYAASGLLPVNITYEEALTFALANEDIPDYKFYDDPIKYRDLSYIITRTYHIKGGLFYRMFKSRRYAFRELLYLEVFEKGSDPNAGVSGADMIQILRRLEILKTRNKREGIEH